jgi:hypothetical protein
MSAVPMRFRPASDMPQGAMPLRGILEHNPGDLKQTAKSSAGTCGVCVRVCALWARMHTLRTLIFMSAALTSNIHPWRTRDSSYVPHTCNRACFGFGRYGNGASLVSSVSDRFVGSGCPSDAQHIRDSFYV